MNGLALIGCACACNISKAAALAALVPGLQSPIKGPNLYEIKPSLFFFFWKASSLFWWYPHSSFLCDQVTTAHYALSTRPGFISYQPMVKALVDSAACIPGSRPGPVVGVIYKKKKKRGGREPALYWWMGPPGCFSWSLTGQLTPPSQVQVQRGHWKCSSSSKKC